MSRVYAVFCFLVLVVSTSAINCLERPVSEMTCYVSSGMLNPARSGTHYAGLSNSTDHMLSNESSPYYNIQHIISALSYKETTYLLTYQSPSCSQSLSLHSRLSLAPAHLEFDHSVFDSHCRW